jgi:hypothetical protein
VVARRGWGVAGCLVDAAAGQPPGHDAGLGLVEMPAGGLLGFLVAPAHRHTHVLTTHVCLGGPDGAAPALPLPLIRRLECTISDDPNVSRTVDA